MPTRRHMPRSKFAAVAALAALVTIFAPAFSETAAPAGRIVLHGATAGSHLKLYARGGRLVAEGRMSGKHPAGCRLRRHRLRAICSLAGVGAVEVEMGPVGDFVEVLNRLPLPLTVHLGAGSDKFVGNGERDTCYSEGSRRNRCVGGAGDDICITGDKNSDCVGGPGDDYCRTGAGSDGCWGGPGNDVCRMGPGHDGCHGEGGDDRLFGGASSDRLYGGAGFDACDGLPGRGRSEGCESGPRR
jgi:Ca2+-binding RTX toxin-like protein